MQGVRDRPVGASASARGNNPPTFRDTFFVNTDWSFGSTLKTARFITGQMYVESLRPMQVTQPYPMVLLHGDHHTGQIWMNKPDGNPGWAAWFLQQGYHVYIVDLPPNGRSNFLNSNQMQCRGVESSYRTLDAAFIERELTAPGTSCRVGKASGGGYDTAKLHNKWPGSGLRGDDTFANYCASTVSLCLEPVERQTLAQNAMQALLQRIGQVVLIGEGSGATAA